MKYTVTTARPALLPLLVFIAWAIYAGFNVFHHEVWRDEVHSWAIAKASSSLADVIARTAYEGHPSLWYFLLYGLQQFSRSVDALQWFHFAIAAAVAALVLWRGRFSLLEKALLLFGYFFVYEYCALARNYAVGLLLMFAFCAFYEKRDKAWGLAGCCLSLFFLAFASLYSYLFSLALGGLLVWRLLEREFGLQAKVSQFFNKKRLKSLSFSGLAPLAWQFPKRILANRPLSLVLAVWLSAASLGALDIQPAPGCIHAPGWNTQFDKERALLTGASVWNGWVPIPRFRLQFWGFNILDGDKEPLDIGPVHLENAFHASCALKICLSLLLLTVAVRRLRRHPALLACLVGLTLLILFLNYTKYPGSLRHFGHYFILWVVCLWLARVDEGGEAKQAEGLIFKVWWHCLLLAHVVAGAIASYHERLHVFSPNEAAAQYLAAQPGFMQEPWVCDADYIAEGVAGILDKEILMMATKRSATYVTWDHPRFGCDHPCLIEKARELSKQSGKDAWILTDHPIKAPLLLSTPDLRMVQDFPSGIEFTDIYWVYRIEHGTGRNHGDF